MLNNKYEFSGTLKNDATKGQYELKPFVLTSIIINSIQPNNKKAKKEKSVKKNIWNYGLYILQALCR